MASEHERYLCEVVFKKPVIVYNYPCAIKAFYMRRNDPGTDGAPGPTCAAMDVLVPGVGELIGGSVREERHDVRTWCYWLRRLVLTRSTVATQPHRLFVACIALHHCCLPLGSCGCDQGDRHGP